MASSDGPKLSRNAAGANQHRERSLMDDLPNLREILQQYVDQGVKQNEIPAKLGEDHGVTVALRTVQKYMKNLSILTARRNGITAQDEATAVGLLTQQDPLGRWGGRLVKEKLSRRSIHIPRNRVTEMLRAENPQAARARHPGTRKVHHHGLWSIGPNEEWCVDGHEKIKISMGISVWGVIDKFSRMELGLWAVPNARVRELPPALFLRLVKKFGGMPLTGTSDKGTELGYLISLFTTLRAEVLPELSEETLPAFKSVTSVKNITRERGWRPVWEKELSNIEYFYESGKVESGFSVIDDIHCTISLWIWGKIVQVKLDEILEESQIHRVRRQTGRLLPTGGRRIDFYDHPERFGEEYEDRLIKIDSETIENLLEKYDRPDLLLFGTAEQDADCQALYESVGSPAFNTDSGWIIFRAMVNEYNSINGN